MLAEKIAKKNYVNNFDKNILVDFDNTIHDMEKFNPDTLTGKPIKGVREYLTKLKKEGYKILIFSARSSTDHEKSKKLIAEWMDKHEIPYDEIVDKKVPAFATIDDRNISFHGDWQDAYEEVKDFEPVQNQGKDKILKHTKWLQLRMYSEPSKGVDGYIYAHEISCDGRKVAILPYIKEGRDGWKVLLREEITPAWGMKPVLSSITGGVEEGEKPVHAAQRELEEETGYKVDPEDFEYLGKCFGNKMMDSQFWLYAIDVSGKEKIKVKGDGSKLERKAKNKFWVWGTFKKSPDPLVAVLCSRRGRTFEENEDIDEYDLKEPLIEDLSEVVHNQWMDLAKGVIATEPELTEKRKKRWKSYFVPYDKLNESNKEKDRFWARKYYEKVKENLKNKGE